jgi:hypothetical protein
MTCLSSRWVSGAGRGTATTQINATQKRKSDFKDDDEGLHFF